MKLSKYYLILFSILLISGFLGHDSANGAVEHPDFNDAGYSAQYYSQSIPDPIQLEAGSSRDVIVRFKNIGEKTWSANSYNFISTYTFNDKYRSSQFANSGWLSDSQPAKLVKDTKFGEIGEFKIRLTAPNKIGDYREEFYLASENNSWIKGGYFFLKLNVVKPEIVVSSPSSTLIKANEKLKIKNEKSDLTSTSIITSTKSNHSAEIIFVSQKSITASAGETINLQIKLKNSGLKFWNGYQWRLFGVYNNSGLADDVVVSYQDWLTDKKILSSNEVIASDKDIDLNFYLRAPHIKGDYKIKFQLVSESRNIIDSNLDLMVKVANTAGEDYTPDLKAPDRDSVGLVEEPAIRIGLYTLDEPVKVKSNFQYAIFSGNEPKGYLEQNVVASLNYTNGKYYYADKNLSFSSPEPIKLKAIDNNSYFEIVNYIRTINWRSGVNYNKYRGNLEIKFSTNKKLPYAVNELPLDDYVKGIAETDNLSNVEYIKAVLVAARSYAYYAINHGTAKDQRTFDVYATTYDQLYLGYNSEVIMPNVVRAAIDTYGQMVTYQSEVVTTPYFGHSDGSTRTWGEVWGGAEKPWLKRVEAKYDNGLSMYGHGVGMSNRDASFRAVKDGWNYKQIL